MGFTEALRLVVDADTSGAVTAVKRLGDTTDKELKRSEQSFDKWGNRLTSLGTGMVMFGVAAVAGLGAMAKQSEDAQLSVLKLQNTLDHMPKLAGESSKQFTDLADSIQSVTAADGDAIVEAEALLGTFNLTAEQIKNVTPLVVDYARKFGVDIPDAAVQVGKALDGQVGALKRNGVSIDENLFKTDRYRAVNEALAKQVGGFAETEGKTFAGSLERMKNELGDLAEGVGGGAVDAFTLMFGAVDKAANALESISPGAQSAIGKFATFAAVGLTAAGGLSILIGQVILARQRFAEMGSAVSNVAGNITRNQLAVVGWITAIAAAVIAAKQFGDSQHGLQLNIENLNSALFSQKDATRASLVEFVKLMDSMGKLDSTFDQVLDSNAAAAKELINVAEAAGVGKDQINSMKAALDEKQATDANATAAQSEYNSEVEAGADAAGDAETATRNLTSAVQAHADALAAQFDPLFAMVSALNSSRDAADKVAEAQGKLNEAIAGGDPTVIAEAQRDYDDALGDSSQALFNVQQKQLALNDAIQRGDVNLATAQRQMFDWAIQAGYTADQALVMAGQLGGAASAARNLGEQDPTVAVSITGVGPVTGDLNALKSKLDAIPREVNIVTRMTTVLAGATNIPMRAAGGPVEAGRAYIVGEHRPELFVPNQSGTILPSVPGGGGGTSVTYQLVFNGPTNDRQVIESIKRFEQSNGSSWRN